MKVLIHKWIYTNWHITTVSRHRASSTCLAIGAPLYLLGLALQFFAHDFSAGYLTAFIASAVWIGAGVGMRFHFNT